jgi:hypothetical protein
MSRGFLKTAAPFSADLVLTIEVGMGAALLVGTVLVRRCGRDDVALRLSKGE